MSLYVWFEFKILNYINQQKPHYLSYPEYDEHKSMKKNLHLMKAQHPSNFSGFSK